jgi:leucyl/phenylalanyl-tRNA--protein transferase
MFILPSDAVDLRFPPVELASPEGLLAIGGDLCSERLLEAYRHGIFPWYSKGQPILWWSPDPRAVLLPEQLKISRSLKKRLRRGEFRVTLDQAFEAVIRACAGPRRHTPAGATWITPEMLDAYGRLHRQGYAHSVETWYGNELVGGLYGVALGGTFFGESMFSLRSDASKVAFVLLVQQLQAWGYTLVDCQLPTPHLAKFGALAIRRREFLRLLEAALARAGRSEPWQLQAELIIV